MVPYCFLLTAGLQTMFTVQIAVAKTNKYATKESGDTVEVVERPTGGFSVVLADGQGSGPAAKILSHMLTTKAVSMIKDGARDGAVARAVHDYLYTYRGGKVSATLVILSVDLATRTLVMSRNSHCPILVYRLDSQSLTSLDASSEAIGLYPKTKPVIEQLPLEPGTYVVTYSDGLMEAGNRTSQKIDIPALVASCVQQRPTARALADFLMSEALRLDLNRPLDDMTALVVSILPGPEMEPGKIVPLVRTMDLTIQVEGLRMSDFGPPAC
ncbi:MAG: serine/threonine-protein phosphatase [Chloroflexota bacterium]|nr:serine/threonine-protein phosphatase [Chloroflexota bacterium]